MKNTSEDYWNGRRDAAEDVRNACLLLGGETVLNMHLIVSSAEGK